jgi:uncharacterized protein with HEPN domain
MWRDDAYMLDMLLAAREIRELTEGTTWERFQGHRMMQHAVVRLIQVIGEASRKISPELRQANPQIPWHEIIGMRNRLIHEYFRIIPDKIWEAVQKDVPALIVLLEPLVPPDKPPKPET